MSNKLGLVTRLVRQSTRRFTTSESRCIAREEVEKLHQKQAFSQSQDEPVHIVHGKMHYYFTSALCVVMRHRALLSTLRVKKLHGAKLLRFSSNKNEGPPPPCAEPVPPCCPTSEEPPPCPPPPPPCGPPCPPPTCTIVPDPNNPCNYVPPENPDPSEPNMTSIKKKQCEFQTDDDVPTYLKGGKYNVYFFQAVTILGAFTLLNSFYTIYKFTQM